MIVIIKDVNIGPKTPKEERVWAEEKFRIDVQHALYDAMQRCGVTDIELAARLGWNTKRISRVFTDECKLSPRDIAAICHVLGVKCHFTVEGDR